MELQTHWMLEEEGKVNGYAKLEYAQIYGKLSS